MADTAKGGGLQVVGLDRAVKRLAKVNPKLKAEAIDVMRDAAKLVQKKSQGRIGNHPGYSMPSPKGMIGRSATSKGAGVRLRRSKYPWSGGGEYGVVYARVYGTWRRESRFKRSIYAPFKPPTSSDMFKNRGGYWIQPTIRKEGRQITANASKKLMRVFSKELRSTSLG